MTIDEIDLRILDMLQRNGKLSQAKIAGAVGLTTPSVNERIKTTERHGMIKGFVALLDHEKMGFPLTAYVDVALEHPRFEKGFIDDLEKILGVQECHYIAGEFPPAPPARAQGRLARAHPGIPLLEEGIDAPPSRLGDRRKEVIVRGEADDPRERSEGSRTLREPSSRRRASPGWPAAARSSPARVATARCR